MPTPIRRRVLLGAAAAALSTPLRAQTARGGGTLRVSVEQAPVKLSPLQHRVGPEYLLGELLYSGLTRLGPGMEAEPDLATSWSANPALTEWMFTLRPGVTFHDGSALTAADVGGDVPRHSGPGDGLAGAQQCRADRGRRSHR